LQKINPLRQATAHIASFFLLLSLSLAFPVQYWHGHSCEAEETLSPHTDSGEQRVDQAHLDCELCDLQVLSFTKLGDSPALAPLVGPIASTGLESIPPYLGAPLHSHQRGPPTA
jgi:hypothetical protein